MTGKMITWLSLILIAVLAVPVILLLFVISLIWSAAGKITAWLDEEREYTRIKKFR